MKDPRLTLKIKQEEILPVVLGSFDIREIASSDFKHIQSVFQLDLLAYIVPEYLKVMNNDVLYYLSRIKVIPREFTKDFRLALERLKLSD